MEGNTIMKAPAFGAFWWHMFCGLGLLAAFWVAQHSHNADRTLLVVWVIQCPIVILLSSFFRNNPRRCSYFRAAGRGLLGLFAGTLVFAFGAISLGAPVGSKYMLSTIYWSLLMSSLAFSPAATIFGASWVDWLRIFAKTRPTGCVDYMVCLPALGSVFGSWFGAWPMPLDWERPWQEWPICVTYGGLVGYEIGMVASFVLIFSSSRRN